MTEEDQRTKIYLMDYKALLIKYIDHVAYEEGTTFITEWMEGFTEEEKKELLFLKGERRHYTQMLDPLVRPELYSKEMKELLLSGLNEQKTEM